MLGNHDVDILDQPTVLAHAAAGQPPLHRGPVLGAYSFDAGAHGAMSSQPDIAGCLVTQAGSDNANQAYTWVVHNDSTRNWVGAPPTAACHAKALTVPDVGAYAKRHGGTGAYTLNGTQSSEVCARLAGCAAAPPPYAAPPVHFVVLNGDFNAAAVPWAAIDTAAPSAGFDWAAPWVPAAQLQWLAQDLALAAGRRQKAIVLVHYRVDGGPGANASAWVDECTLNNALVLRDVLHGAGNVLATFSGHDHTPNPAYTVGTDNVLMFTHRAMVEGPHATSNAFSVVTLFSNCTLEIKGHGNATSLVHHGLPGCSVG